MDSSLKKSDRLAHARQFFESIGLSRWSLDSHAGEVAQGGQNAVCRVIRDDGLLGVFRCLPPVPTETEKRRFEREIGVLGQLNHPNVMKPLVSSEVPMCWYISELGEDLNDYWKQFRSQNPIAQVEAEAIRLFRDIADGIEACHDKFVVHRDIKPSNIVVYIQKNGATPRIIDFGAVWISDEHRLTEIDDAVGNRGYSPDPQRQRLDKTPPWVDIFSAVQVFQWMLAEREAKHYWQRPIHWKYINYPQGSSTAIIASIRALGAISSIESACPKDGRKLVELLGNLFPRSLATTSREVSKELKARVDQGISNGLQRKLIREAMDLELLTGSALLAAQRLQPLVDALAALIDPPRIRLSASRTVSDVIGPQFGSSSNEVLLQYDCCLTSKRKFTVCLRVQAFVPSRWPNGGKAKSLEDANVFVFTIERNGDNGNNISFPHLELKLTIEANGALMLRDTSWGECIRTITIPEICTEVTEMLTEPLAWECLSDR